MAAAFHVHEHVVNGQHIREYPRATAHAQEEVLKLAVKQYVPRNNPDPRHGDLTIVASHANGFPKELYEALWEDLVNELAKRDVRVRGIWIADVACQGQSGILNETSLGNEPSWFDSARDILHMINHFRHLMPRPIVGLGHSFGASIMVHLSLLHPRLLTSLVLIDPVLTTLLERLGTRGPDGDNNTNTTTTTNTNNNDSKTKTGGFNAVVQSFGRRDLWPSRAAAASSFRANAAFYGRWDPRVLDAWVAHGLRDAPTELYPSAPPGSVTLATTKHMECFTYFRPLYQTRDPQKPGDVLDRSLVPDAAPSDLAGLALAPPFPFYRAESRLLADALPRVRPQTLYVFGGTSDMSTPPLRDAKLAATGTCWGRRAREAVVEGHGHLVPMEVPGLCAAHAAGFLAAEVAAWRADEDAAFQAWAALPDREKRVMSEDWARWIAPHRRARPREKKL